MTTKYKTSYENLEASLPENLVVEEYLLTAVGVSRFGLEALFFTDVLKFSWWLFFDLNATKE